MKALLAVLLLVLVPVGASLGADPARAVVAVGQVRGHCPDAVLALEVHPDTRSGAVVEQGVSCHHSAEFLGALCVPGTLTCEGECRVRSDAAAECWWGTPEHDELLSPSYLRLDADGSFVWRAYGALRSHGTLARLV